MVTSKIGIIYLICVGEQNRLSSIALLEVPSTKASMACERPIFNPE